MVVATHDADLVDRYARRAIRLESGRVVEDEEQGAP